MGVGRLLGVRWGKERGETVARGGGVVRSQVSRRRWGLLRRDSRSDTAALAEEVLAVDAVLNAMLLAGLRGVVGREDDGDVAPDVRFKLSSVSSRESIILPASLGDTGHFGKRWRFFLSSTAARTQHNKKSTTVGSVARRFVPAERVERRSTDSQAAWQVAWIQV
jgi:hypothetical protein